MKKTATFIGLLLVCLISVQFSACSKEKSKTVKVDNNGVHVSAPGTDVKIDHNGIQIKAPRTDIQIGDKK